MPQARSAIEAPSRLARLSTRMRGLLVSLFLLSCTPSPSAETPAAAAPPKVVRAKKPGDKVTPFSAKDAVTGTTIGLAPGKVNLVWFWATWSIDNKAMPHIAKLAKKYPELNVVLVSVDDEAKYIPEFLRTYDHGGELRTIWDARHVLASEYFEVPCSPTFYVIDRHGVVAEQFCGFHDGQVESYIEPLCKSLF
jgi:thiol-disulfide isomerase/thioredoxin